MKAVLVSDVQFANSMLINPAFDGLFLATCFAPGCEFIPYV
jgi:hypothetical protein